MCSTDHNETSQQWFSIWSSVFPQGNLILVLEVIFSKSINESNVCMAFVCYKCHHCNGEYRSLRSYDHHRRHQLESSAGNLCSDGENNIQSLSLNEEIYRQEYYDKSLHHVLVSFMLCAMWCIQIIRMIWNAFEKFSIVW